MRVWYIEYAYINGSNGYQAQRTPNERIMMMPRYITNQDKKSEHQRQKMFTVTKNPSKFNESTV